MDMQTWEVRNIDAWSDDERGWYENQTFASGKIELPVGFTNRQLFRAMRIGGYLTERSAGKVAVEDRGDGEYLWIVSRANREPLFAVVKPYNVNNE